MIEFYEFKNQIIKELSQFIDKTEPSESKYLTYKAEISLNNISALIPYLKEITTCYFKTPDDKEILGLGELEYFNSLMEVEQLTALTDKNADLDFMGAIPFDYQTSLNKEWEDFNGHNIFLPKFVIIKQNNKTFFKANFHRDTKNQSVLKMNLLSDANSLFKFIHRDFNKYKIKSEIFPTSKEHWGKMIDQSQISFSEKEISKVVLARKKIISFEKEISSHRLFSDLSHENNLYEFFFHIAHGSSFISFTPEKLYHLKENTVSIDSIAGTIKRSDSTDGSELLSSEKDLEEHRIVSRYIESNLKEIGAIVTKTSSEELLMLPKLIHIHSKFNAVFDKPISNYKLLNKLHPTPAVGGFPKRKAVSFIKQNENMNRGLYAGPIGHISKNESEFAVGIRSILVKDNSAHFFGGAGIVEQSISENEWKETGDKIESVQCLM